MVSCPENGSNFLNIFATMIILRVQAVLLVVILLMPLAFSSFCEWSGIEYNTELFDDLPLRQAEEGEVEEGETKKDKEVEETEKLAHRYELDFVLHSSDVSKYLSACSLFASHSGDVLTPPPESI